MWDWLLTLYYRLSKYVTSSVTNQLEVIFSIFYEDLNIIWRKFNKISSVADN